MASPIPRCGPVSQYFDSRRAWVSANTNADPSAVGVNPFAKYSPSTSVVAVPSASSRNKRAAPACLHDRGGEVLETEVARRLGEIDCAVRCFGDVRAELEPSAGDRFDKHVQRAAGRVEGEQSTMAVADQDAAIASDVQTERSTASVGDDCGLAAVGRNPHDAPVLQTRPQLAGRVDYDILGPVPRQRDDGNTRRRHVWQRVDRWRLPTDRVDTWFARHAKDFRTAR